MKEKKTNNNIKEKELQGSMGGKPGRSKEKGNKEQGREGIVER